MGQPAHKGLASVALTLSADQLFADVDTPQEPASPSVD